MSLKPLGHLLVMGVAVSLCMARPAWANTDNLYAKSKHASDTSGEAATDIWNGGAADLSTDETDPTPSAISAAGGDDQYFVNKGLVMHLSGVDRALVLEDTITAVSLYAKWSSESTYGGTNPVQWRLGEAGTWRNTTITPPTGTQSDLSASFDLYAAGADPVQTWANLDALQIRFVNNDGGGAGAVSFDVVRLTVTWTQNPMDITDVTVEQPNTGTVYSGLADNDILRIKITTTGSGSAANLTSLTITEQCTDIGDLASANTKGDVVLYWTGTSSTFATTSQLGSSQDFAAEDGTVIFSGLSQAISNGVNYVWAAVAVRGGATNGNTVDMKLVVAGDITFSADNTPGFTLTTPNPAGSRTIAESADLLSANQSAMVAANWTWRTNDAAKISGATSSTGGNPADKVAVTFASNGTATAYGLYETSFSVPYDPVAATLSFDWRIAAFTDVGTAADTIYAKVFIDTAAGAPVSQSWVSLDLKTAYGAPPSPLPTSWMSVSGVDVFAQVPATGTYYVKVALTTSSGKFNPLTIEFDNVQIAVKAGNRWKTTGTTAWNTATNWTDGTVPVAGGSVGIPSGGTQPTLSGTAGAVAKLTVNTGATLTIDGVGLTIGTLLTLNGALVLQNGGSLTISTLTIPSGASVTVNGSSTVTATTITVESGGSLALNATSTCVFDTLTVSSGATLTIAGTSSSSVVTLKGRTAVFALSVSGTINATNFQVYDSAGLYGGVITINSGATLTALGGAKFRTHPGTTLAYLDFTNYAQAATLVGITFNNETGVTTPYTITPPSAAVIITIAQGNGSLGSGTFINDPNGRIRWYTATPQKQSSVGGGTDSDTLISAINAGNGTVTVYDNVPTWGDLTLNGSTMPTTTSVTIARAHIIGNFTLNKGTATVTLQNCMIVGNVTLTAGTLNLTHCNVLGTVNASTINYCLVSGAITGTQTLCVGSAGAAVFVNSGADNDLHLNTSNATVIASVLNAGGDGTTTVDFDGAARPMNGTRDIGADEADNSAQAAGALDWNFAVVNQATPHRLGPVTFLAQNPYYRVLVVGTGKEPGNSDPDMWENALLIVDMDDGTLLAGMCGLGTQRVASYPGAYNLGFPNSTDFQLPGPVDSTLNYFDTATTTWKYHIQVVCDANLDGRAETMRHFHYDFPSNVIPSKSTMPTWSSFTKTWTSDFTVSEGPISEYVTLSVEGAFPYTTYQYLAADQDTGRKPSGNPVLYKMLMSDGSITNTAADTYSYSTDSSVFSTDGVSLLAGLKASGTPTDVDLIRFVNTMTVTHSVPLTDRTGTVHNDGLGIPPRFGMNGQQTMMVATADQWLRRVSVGTVAVDATFNGGLTAGYIGLEDDGISTVSTSSAHLIAPELFWGLNYYLGAYTTNEKRSYVYKLAGGTGAATDPDWKTASRAALRGAVLRPLTVGSNRNAVFAATDEGFVYRISFVNTGVGSGDDGVFSAGFPVRVGATGILHAAFNFNAATNNIFVVTLDQRLLAYKLSP